MRISDRCGIPPIFSSPSERDAETLLYERLLICIRSRRRESLCAVNCYHRLAVMSLPYFLPHPVGHCYLMPLVKEFRSHLAALSTASDEASIKAFSIQILPPPSPERVDGPNQTFKSMQKRK